ncbi:MAG: DUF3800 domain-containing protein [Gammaproteobacteria bacterium]|nr:DUF3800 domain-containing protein [Gammaproteobacteria bacterium]
MPLAANLNIEHERSHETYGIQAVDLFCWGIYRKYECNDLVWYNLFKDRIIAEEIFRG